MGERDGVRRARMGDGEYEDEGDDVDGGRRGRVRKATSEQKITFKFLPSTLSPPSHHRPFPAPD